MKSGSLFSNVMTLATGTAIAQVITLATTPFITRIYGPENFGLQGVFIAIVSMLAPIATIGLSTAIILPKHEYEAKTLAKMATVSSVVCAIAITMLIFFGEAQFLQILKAQSIEELVYFIPIALLISAINSILTQWLIRYNAYKISAKYTALTAAITGTGKITIGLQSATAATLIAANTAGVFIGTLLTFAAWRAERKQATAIAERMDATENWRLTLKKYQDFPLLRTPQNLINAFSQSLPILMLSAYSGSGTAGQYTLAITALGAPAALIGNAISSAFYPKISQTIHAGNKSSPLIIKTTLTMLAAGILPLVLIIAFAPDLFEITFGSAWEASGLYAQILATWVFFQFLNKPAVAAIPALRLQGGLLIYELISTGLKIISLWIGLAIMQSPTWAISMFSAFGVLSYAWLIAWTIAKAKKQESKDNHHAASH